MTSLGKLGGIISTPILNHPESAILAVNAVRELPRYIDGELQPRSIMNLSISVDHRIADCDDERRDALGQTRGQLAGAQCDTGRDET